IPPGADGLSNYETVDNVTLEVGFTKDRILGYRFRPAVIREMHRPEFVDPAGAEGQRIMNRLWDAVDALPPWEGASPPDAPPAQPEPEDTPIPTPEPTEVATPVPTPPATATATATGTP